MTSGIGETSGSGQTVTERADEVADYVAAVAEALADLPDRTRDELLEDLPAHLSEVAADDPALLVDQLGPPEGYAEELRAAIDPASVGADGSSGTPRLVLLRDRLLGRLRRADVRVGPLIGYERFSEFARLLVPAWWVLRGYLAAMLAMVLLSQDSIGLLPRLGGSTLVGLIVLAVFGPALGLAAADPVRARQPARPGAGRVCAG